MQPKPKIQLLSAILRTNGRSVVKPLNNLIVDFNNETSEINKVKNQMAQKYNIEPKNIDVSTKLIPIIKIQRWEQK